MKSIHLTEKNAFYVCVDSNTNEWETGNWFVSVKSAAELVNGNIYLHKTQKDASYMGGIITGLRVIKQNDKDKIVFSSNLQLHMLAASLLLVDGEMSKKESVLNKN
jgi:hypothetical protein